MKRRFQNLAIQCWQLDGKLGLSLACICVQAAAPACDILLEAIDELATDAVPSKRTLTLLPCERKKQCSTIRLMLSPASDELRQMSLTKEQETAIFEFTPLGLKMFREAVVIWRNGGQDFSVHPYDGLQKKTQDLGAKDLASGEVWFWTPFMEP